MKNKSLKNNIINFPIKMSESEREIEAILFAAEEPLDAEPDYEGQTHDPKYEQFKHKESEYDAATGQKKGLGAVGLNEGEEKSDSPGFNAIYGQSGGVAGRDASQSGKSGKVGVPDYNNNSFGIKYVKTNKNGQFWCEQHQAWEDESTHTAPSGVGR